MDEIVTQYLPQAFAFIYVINSANAGGVQKDRVSGVYNLSFLKNQQYSTPYSTSTFHSTLNRLLIQD